jgi:hypothetical protein
LDNLKRQAIDLAFAEMEERARGAASSIVDPETGKHADVFVYRNGDAGISVRTKGSPAFARELERRIGLRFGAVTSDDAPISADAPRVYLARASEDHETLARPLAERFLANGIDVWLDEWEIRAGDSLRQKMEEGLGDCTHFVVLLTPRSHGKPWVETEIDAGFVRSIQGKSRFIGLRVGTSVAELSPFLQTLLCPELALDNAAALGALIADIHNVSRKPALGPAPRYVKSVPDGLAMWSKAAIAVAEHLVRESENGVEHDPQLEFSAIGSGTGLPEEDVRLGVLDLSEAGLVKSQEWGEDEGVVWPLAGLFVEFNQHVFQLDSKTDALAIASWLVGQGVDGADATEVAGAFPDWPVRRLNGALNYLDAANIVKSLKGYDGRPYAMVCLHVTDKTRRFVRDNS